MKKKLLGSMLLGVCAAVSLAVPAMADSRKVVTLGADLSQDQMDTMMRYFGVGYDGVEIIYINNDDEREHLGSYVPLEQIGTHTYSCALVNPTSSGGIQVKTANLEWVPCNMIASTLSTSGVTNCQVVAACPFKVSGTGALTGVIMAYENASQETLDPVKVELANQELVTTGNLANDVGQSKATAVMNETKVQVIENNVTNVEQITDIVNNVSNDYDVDINEEQSAQIVELMQQIAQQEYDIVQLKATLDRVQANVAGDAGASEEAQKAAEEQAKASEAAALEAARQEQEEQLNNDGALADEGVVIVDGGDELLPEENILENTDPSILEDISGPVDEADTTQTVQEQSEQQTETDEWSGWDVTDDTFGEDPDKADGGAAEVLPDDTFGEDPDEADGGAKQTEALPEEPATELTDELQGQTPDNLNEEDRKIYDAVEEDMEIAFEQAVVTSADGSRTVFLDAAAAEEFPKKIERYLLRVLMMGVDAISAEEAANPQISQDIVQETAEAAPDRMYEDEKLAQIDKYVRRLVFRDSENFLEQSYLEDADKTVLYDTIMDIVENAFKPETETVDDGLADAAEAADPFAADEAEYVGDGSADEFASFDESFGEF